MGNSPRAREALRTACAKASMADPEIVEIPSHQASCEKLGQMLAAPAFHIFHFAGHGFPDHFLLNDKGQPEERVQCGDEHKPHPQLSRPDWTTLPGAAFSRDGSGLLGGRAVPANNRKRCATCRPFRGSSQGFLALSQA